MSAKPRKAPHRKWSKGAAVLKCESDLIIRSGRYGKFIGCSSYPNCKFIEPLEKPEDTGVQCPDCKKGNILKRKSTAREGVLLLRTLPRTANTPSGTSRWHSPARSCHWPITSIKTTKRSGTQRVCPQQDCKFAEPWDAPVPAMEKPEQ